MSETNEGLVQAQFPGGITITGTPTKVAETIRLVQGGPNPQGPQTGNTPFVRPWPEVVAEPKDCTCYSYGTWMSVLPPPPCPVHGGGHITVTYTG